MKQQIIAIGGGDISKDSENYPIANYILSQAHVSMPNICFLATATGDADGNIVRFYEIFNRLHCRPTHLSLFSPPKDWETLLFKQHVIYVGGGNTRNLLALWKAWQLDKILKRALAKGILLSGFSAGSICWFEQGLSDYDPGKFNPIQALGFIKGSHCPHYDSEPQRRPAYHQFIEKKILKSGFAVDDDVALHFINGELHKTVRSFASGFAYRVSLNKGKLHEQQIIPEDLTC